MPWDDDRVLQWREESARPSKTHGRAHSILRDFRLQLWSLALKNRILFTQSRAILITLLVMPVGCMVLLGLVDWNYNQPPGIVTPEGPFYTLSSSPTAGTRDVGCRVFATGAGTVISGAWCAPMVFSPTLNGAVVSLMEDVAERKGWGVRTMSSEQANSTAMPAECALPRCVLGFESSDDLGTWLSQNRGRAGTAIVFVEYASSLNGTLVDLPDDELPQKLAFEVWYNETALDFYAKNGDDKLAAGLNESSGYLMGAQHVVEEAVLARRLGRSELRTRVNFRQYPYVERKEFTDGVRLFGGPFFFMPLGLPMLLIVNQVVGEKELGSLAVMRQLGLYEGAWWLSFAVQQAVLIGVIAVIMITVGITVRLPFFVMTDFAVLFPALWLYGMALSSVAISMTVCFSRTRSANVWAGVVFGFLMVTSLQMGLLYAGSFAAQDVVNLMHDPTVVRAPEVNGLAQVVYPPYAFFKIAYDITELTRRSPDIDPQTNLTIFVMQDTYEHGDLYRGNYTGEIQMLFGADGDTFTLPPTSESFEWLGVSIIASLVATWYLSQVTTSAYGQGRPPWFFLLHSYWWQSESVRGNEQLLARYRAHAHPRDLEHLDVDVAAEAYAVLGGNLSEERRVALYDVQRRFGKSHAVRGLSFSMQEDEIFALLGHNGAGKSTTINVITGHYKPSAGDTLVYGASVQNDTQVVRKMVGLCPQHDVLYDTLSAREHLRLIGRFKGVSRRILLKQVPAALKAVRLSGVADKAPGTFSGGMKRRLSVAMAYIGEPRLVVLDEPTTGMDPYNRKFVWDLISHSREERTTLLTTHSMEEAEALGNTIGIMSHGQLTALGSNVHLKMRFGAGYTLRLVAGSEPQLRTLQAQVRGLMPTAELLDDSAGSCTYAIAESEMGHATPLLKYIEELQVAQGDGSRAPVGDEVQLTDWLLTHTTLEEVFIRLAQSARTERAPGEAESDADEDVSVYGRGGGGGGGSGAGAPAAAPAADASSRSPSDVSSSLAKGAARIVPRMLSKGVLTASSASAPAAETPSKPPGGLSHPPLRARLFGTAVRALGGRGSPASPPADGPSPAEAAEQRRLGARGAFRRLSRSMKLASHFTFVERRRRSRPLMAAVWKNIAIYRRQTSLKQMSNLCVPLLLLSGLVISQVLLIDIAEMELTREADFMTAHIAEACENVTRLFDEACEERISLRRGTDLAEDCRFCAQEEFADYQICCELERSWIDSCHPNQCVGTAEGARTAAPPDFSLCESAPNASSLCVCRDDEGERSAALQQRLDETPMCKAYNERIRGRLASASIVWMPTDDDMSAFEGVDTWLGWRVPVFAPSRAGFGRLETDQRGGTYLRRLQRAPWGSGTVFEGSTPAALARAADGLTEGQYNVTRDLRNKMAGEGLARFFPATFARTRFGSADGQPSAECVVASSTVRCCFEAELSNLGAPNAEGTVEICGDLGALGEDCPGRFEDDPREFARAHFGWNDDVIDEQGVGFVSPPSGHYYLAEGKLADVKGRPTQCTKAWSAEWETPLCMAVRARGGENATSATCAEIRADFDTWFPLVEPGKAREPVTGDDFSWTAEEWRFERSWRCSGLDDGSPGIDGLDVSCVAYEAFLVPAYTPLAWRTQDELNAHVLRQQASIQSAEYVTRDDVPLDVDYSTELNIAEHLFPSWAVDLVELDLRRGVLEWTLTSFFRLHPNDPFAEYFYVSEPLGEDLTGQPAEGPRRESLAKPFKLQGQLQLERLMPSVLHNAFTNALVKEELGPRYSVRVGFRPMPEAKERVPAWRFDILAYVTAGAMPIVCTMLLPSITFTIVQEKQFKLRSLMNMMGLSEMNYWLVEWVFASLVSHFSMAFFWACGYAFGARYFTRSLVALFLALQVWAQLQVSLAFLASCAFQRVRPASVIVNLVLFSSVTAGVTVWVLSQEDPTNVRWRTEYDFWPFFAFFHVLWLATESSIAVPSLLDLESEVGRAFMFLLFHLLWTYPLAFYLDAILPREFGLPAHPLFCFVRTGASRRRAAKREPREALTREHVPPNVFSLRKTFGQKVGQKVAINNLSFKIDRGECFGLLGTNGAGKSTTISVLTGLFHPTSGTATIAGYDILTHMSKIYTAMGVCPQFDILWPELTVLEHILFYSRLKGVPRREESTSARRTAESVGLGAKLRSRIHTLSGGQKRRVSLAMALIGKPAVVFLDEPTTGLDPETKRLMWQLIEDSKANRVIVLTTHSMDEADALCSRIGIMAYGELRALGTNIHLKNTFGDGYKIDVTLMPSQEERVHGFILSIIPTAELLNVFVGSRTYKVRRRDVSLASVFQRMERRPANLGLIDWGLRQTTLEEVFLKIAHEAEAAASAVEPPRPPGALSRRKAYYASAISMLSLRNARGEAEAESERAGNRQRV